MQASPVCLSSHISSLTAALLELLAVLGRMSSARAVLLSKAKVLQCHIKVVVDLARDQQGRPHTAPA